MSKDNNNGLLSFEWDEDTDFNFGEPTKTDINEVPDNSTDDPSEDEEEEVEDKPKSKAKPKKGEVEEVEEDEDEDFFEVDDQTKPTKKENENTPTTSIFNDLYSDLKENGIFKHVELEEGEELDSERFFELQEQEIETEISARLEAWVTQELDEDAKAFIKFKRDGGSTQDFFKTYSDTPDIEAGDIEDEDYQDNLIRYQLAKEGWDEEEIEDRLEILTNKGTKEKFARKYYDKIESELESKRENLLKTQAQQREQARRQEMEFKQNIDGTLKEIKDVKGMKFTDGEKNEILSFLTKKNEKINDEVSVTGFQKGLSEVFKDTNKLVLLAKLIKNDFDFSGIEKQAITKKTKEIKTKIEQRQSNSPFRSGSSLNGQSLSDLFDK